MFFTIIIIAIMLEVIITMCKIDKFSKIFLTIFNLIITILLCFSTTNPYGLFPVSDKTYIIWLINLMCFTIVYILFALRKKNEEIIEEYTDNNFDKVLDKIVKSKIWNTINIIVMILLIYYVVKYNNIISEIIDPALWRMVRFTTLFDSYKEKVIFEYIIMGAFTIFSIITSILLVNKKWKNIFFFVGIANIILYVSIGFSRKVLFEFLMYIVIAYAIMFIFKKKKINKRIILTGAVLLIIILIVILALTSIRTGVKIWDFKTIYEEILQEQVKQFIIYFEGPFRALDYFIENGFPSLEGKLSYGRATLGGVDEIISLPLIFVGIDYPYFNSIVGSDLQSYITIGDNISFNALYTGVMNYYCDFGVYGVIILSTLYAIFTRWCVEKSLKKQDAFSQILMIFVVMNTISTIYKWNYQSGATTFILIVLLLLNSNKLIKKGKRWKEI